MRARSFGWSGLGLVVLVGCGSQATPDGAPAPIVAAAPARDAIAYFEGRFDASTRTLEMRSAASQPELATQTQSWLPYGTASGDVYFHTCNVTWTAGPNTLVGTVQAVNKTSGSILHVKSVIDAVSPTGVTPASGTIASYGTVAASSPADCSTSQTWTFTVPSGSNFSFRGHAEGDYPGTVASFALSEGAGTTAADGTGNGHTGTVSSASWGSSGIVTSGTTTSYLEAGGFSDIGNAAMPFSFALWVKPASDAGTLVHVTSGSNGLGWCTPFMGFDGSGRLVSQVLFAGSSSSYSVATDPTPLPLNAWTHVAMTWSPTTNTNKLYVNGTMVASSTIAGYAASGQSMFVIWGSDSQGGGCWHGNVTGAEFAGGLDDVGIYNVELSPTQVAALASAGH